MRVMLPEKDINIHLLYVLQLKFMFGHISFSCVRLNLATSVWMFYITAIQIPNLLSLE